MADLPNNDDLPDYANPPVVETVLGVQFERLSGFKNAHLGAFWKMFDQAEWPTVRDAPALPPQAERFDALWPKGLQLKMTQDPASRAQFKNHSEDRLIQVQSNRLHFNWLGGTYPRYPEVRTEFRTVLSQFIEFVKREEVGDFRPNQWEITYINVIPRGSIWESPEEWTFFKPLEGVPTIDGLLQGESFEGQWHFIIPDQRGRLHVRWQHGKGPEESEAVTLTFTARGPVEETDIGIAPILSGLDLGRRTIVLAFQRLMTDEANRYWGLK